MTQLQTLANVIAGQTKLIDTDGKAIDVQLTEVRRCQDEYLEAKTKLAQMQVKYRSLVRERDENLNCIKNLSRIALNEFNPLYEDKETEMLF